MKLVLLILAVAASVFGLSQSAHGQTAGSVIGSETVIYTFSNSTQLDETVEAKISSNSSLVVQTVLVETISSATPSIAVGEWKVYGPSGEPFVYKGLVASLPTSSDDGVRAVAGTDVLPLGAPEGGSIGLILQASGLTQDDQVRVTFVYIANAGSEVSAEIRPATQFPLYVTENSRPMTGNASTLEINDSFVNPEIHCETCTIVKRLDAPGQAGAAYIANATDLTGAAKFTFLAMGEDGGESVTFNVAGKEQNNTIAYANATRATLGSDWKRYEIDLAGADLTDITHLFGFELNSGQAFYVKGAAYN